MPTGIEWTDETLNWASGCNRTSPGCDHCYALTLAKRLKAMGQPNYQADGDSVTSGPGFGLTLHPEVFAHPAHWRQPRKLFVNSMSDTFHPGIPRDQLAVAWAAMGVLPQHTFQVLTKRAPRVPRVLNDPGFRKLVAAKALELRGHEDRALARAARRAVEAWHGQMPWPLPNVWVGVSVESQRYAELRVDHLLRAQAVVRWLSVEPLLGPVDLRRWLPSLERLEPAVDWVVVGGESGPKARPMHPDWARGVRDACLAAGVAFLFKQVGGRTPKAGGRLLDGRTWDQFPSPSDAVRALTVHELVEEPALTVHQGLVS